MAARGRSRGTLDEASHRLGEKDRARVSSRGLSGVPGKSPLGKRPSGTGGKAPGQPHPQLEPIWERTASGWWVVEYNGMLRSGPFKDKEQGRGWFYKELDIKLSI